MAHIHAGGLPMVVPDSCFQLVSELKDVVAHDEGKCVYNVSQEVF